MNDETLVRRLQAGDREAFDVLYERYRNEVYRTACLITGSRADGEDLTQEAFVTALGAIGSLRDPARFRHWLLRLLTRAAWKYCRKARREAPVEAVLDGAAEDALSACLRSETQRQLYAAVAALDEKRRTVVVLHYFQDLPVREIARILEVTEGTVKSRLYSARRHLRQALTEETQQLKEAANHG